MKAIKMIGLTALTALLAMAFVGASSAMAESTALCDEDPVGTEVCPAGHLLNSVHEESVGKAKLLTNFLTVECNVLFSGSISTTLANPLVISGNFTYTNCGSCTITEENGPSELDALKEGHELGKVKLSKFLIHVVCGKSLDCSYNGVALAATARGPLLSAQVPDNGEASLQGQAMNKEAGGFLCPKTSTLDIVTTPLTAIYIKS